MVIGVPFACESSELVVDGLTSGKVFFGAHTS